MNALHFRRNIRHQKEDLSVQPRMSLANILLLVPTYGCAFEKMTDKEMLDWRYFVYEFPGESA